MNPYKVVLFILVGCGILLHGTEAVGYSKLDGSETNSDVMIWKPVETHVSLCGTSNVRDWEVKADTLAGYLRISRDAALSVSLYLPVDQLESGYSAMNNTMYESLNHKEYHDIKYQLDAVVNNPSCELWKLAERPAIDTFKCEVKVNGVITAAGEKHVIQHVVMLEVEGDVFVVKGDMDLKMTDFKIEPPQYLGGALNTADEFTIRFAVSMIPQES